MREFEQHLSPDLFHRLVEAGETEKRAPELESAERHIADCAVCRQRLEQFRAAQRGLDGLRLMVSEERMKTPECPPESEWANVAAGLVEGTEAATRVDHAARCAYCGPLLREAMEDLAVEPSDEERRAIELLPSAQEANQQRIAARLASTPGGVESRLPARRNWTWAFVGAMAAALIFAAILFYGRLANPYGSAGKLLAEAYMANRNLELRIPGAAYAPLSTVRGTNSSQPLPLLRAEVLIDRQLEAHPQSAAWMALQGRAQLLQGQFDAARSTLQQALRLEPNSPAILTDLATAEYALSEQEGQSERSMAAAEHLSEALKLQPNDPVALYNRALVYESIGSLPLALKDWERYLSLDPSSAWATNVAREHLGRLKKRLGSSPQSELPPSDPVAAAPWLANRLKQPEPPAGTLDSADEQLLDLAVTRWLPDAYASATPPAQRQADRAALGLLAKELVKRHGDHWLADVLATSPSPSFAAGFAALAQAVRLDIAGRPDEAQKQAARAENLLRAAHNPAALRAQAELAYAYQREISQASRCASTAESTLRDLGNRSYPWIEVQLLLEQSSCEGMLWHLGAYRRSAERAVAISRSSGYGTIFLRGVGFVAATERDVGDYRKAWREDQIGIGDYWNGQYPPVRAFQFYSDMTFSAEAAEDWWVDEGLAQEGVEMIAQTPNKPVEAMARFRLATAANLAGDRATAGDQFRASARILASLPADPTLQTYEAYIQVYLADLEVQTGSPRQAQRRLLKAESLVRKSDNDELGLRFYGGLGDAYLAEGDASAAESSLLKAVAIAERGLRSLKTGSERVSWAEVAADAYRGLVRAELGGQDDPTAALGIWEWYRSGPLRAQQSQANDPISKLLPASEETPSARDASVSSAFRIGLQEWLKDAQPRLRDEIIISYAQFRDGVQIWAFGDRGVTSRWVAVPKTQFDIVARHFEEECSDPKSSLALLQSDGRQLYRWLIAPVESRLSPSRVLAFETDGAISGIPLQALVDAGGEYLGDRFAVMFSPGLGYESLLRRNMDIKSSDRILAIGAPALRGEWQSMFSPLPEANAEAHAVASNFRSATLLTGEQATLRAVLHDLPETQIFHFAGHALTESKRTGLVLAAGVAGLKSEGADGGGATVLAASQINSSNLRNCRLVVLSACSTAAGEGATLVDPESLVGSFLLAGVPDVVASRWNVDSTETTSLMQIFYRRLLAGDSVARALQRASKAVRMQPETAHPYFWAAFGAYGR
ncbi:MAG: CHAT domain-containing protein [Acidobacteriota bacterium]|nr:CHAT domain-containing protein [Acidobacteriota bacterium]